MNLRRKKQAKTDGIAPRPVTPQRKVDGKYDFNNKYVCITGTITGKTRTQAQSQLKAKFPNVKFQSQVTSSTDFLITGYGVGQTKLRAAARWGATTIDAQEVFK